MTRRGRRAASAVELTLSPEVRRAAPKAVWLAEVGLLGRSATSLDAVKRRSGWWNLNRRSCRIPIFIGQHVVLSLSSRSLNRKQRRLLHLHRETRDDVPISCHLMLALSLTPLRTLVQEIAGALPLLPPKLELPPCPLVLRMDLPHPINYKP